MAEDGASYPVRVDVSMDQPQGLIVNAGSSSLELSLLEDDGTVAAARTVQPWEGAGHLEPLEELLAGCGGVDAVATASCTADRNTAARPSSTTC